MKTRLLTPPAEEGIVNAKKIYRESSSTKPKIIARLQLSSPLPISIYSGTEWIGTMTNRGQSVQGTIYQDAYVGDSVLYVSYDSLIKDQQHPNTCPTNSNQVDDTSSSSISSCLVRKGSIQLQDDRHITLAYDFYDPYHDNSFGITLQTLSLDANQKFYKCLSCPYSFFLMVRD
jgi:hypothetical protein